MPGKTLITGGAGFIGSHLAEHLKDRRPQLILVDNLSTGRLANVEHLLDDRCRLIAGSVAQSVADDPDLFEGVEEVYHLAAAVGVAMAMQQPLHTIHTNVDETAIVLEHASRCGAAVLIASSSEVYGKSPKIPMHEEDDLVLGPTSSPRWSYALSKAIDEHLVLARHVRGDLSAVVVRLFNIIGPRQIGQYGMVVPRFIQWALTGQDITIYGDGTQSRTFCNVCDAVEAMDRLLSYRAHHGRVYNVGSDHEITIKELAATIIALTGSAASTRFVPYDQAYDQRYEDPARRVPDLRRIVQAIDFQPRYSLHQTIEQLVSLQKQVACK